MYAQNFQHWPWKEPPLRPRRAQGRLLQSQGARGQELQYRVRYYGVRAGFRRKPIVISSQVTLCARYSSECFFFHLFFSSQAKVL
jgi:hypothetical protein